MFYAPFHSKKQGVLDLANLTLQHDIVLCGIQSKSGNATMERIIGSWLVIQCHLNRCREAA